MRGDQRGRNLLTLTILPIDTDGYIPPQSSDPLIMTKIRRQRGPAITDLMVAAKQGGSCLRTIVRRLPNLSALRELPAVQLPACSRLKAWLLPPTGLRWKSTRLRGTVYAEHKPRLAGDLFSRPHK
jgi:hypothetical protein